MKLFSEFLEERELLSESPNLTKDLTGLPCNIFVSIEYTNHNKPRIKFQNNYSDSVTSNADYIPMSIPTSDKEQAEILVDKKLNVKQKDINLIKSWVKKYSKILIKYWKQDIGSIELKNFFIKER